MCLRTLLLASGTQLAVTNMKLSKWAGKRASSVYTALSCTNFTCQESVDSFLKEPGAGVTYCKTGVKITTIVCLTYSPLLEMCLFLLMFRLSHLWRGGNSLTLVVTIFGHHPYSKTRCLTWFEEFYLLMLNKQWIVYMSAINSLFKVVILKRYFVLCILLSGWI